jgi:hypothetical protein
LKNEDLILYILNYDLYLDKLYSLLFLSDISYLLLKSYTKQISDFNYYKNSSNSAVISNDIIKTLNSLIKQNKVVLINKNKCVTLNKPYTIIENSNQKEIIDLVLNKYLNIDYISIYDQLNNFNFFKQTEQSTKFNHDLLRSDEMFKKFLQKYLQQ